jgi:hypothetical protein
MILAELVIRYVKGKNEKTEYVPKDSEPGNL